MTNKLPYIAPLKLLQMWPNELPILYLGGSEKLQYIAASFEEVDWHKTKSQPIKQHQTQSTGQGFAQGYMGVASYNSEAPNRIFRVDSALAFDMEAKKLWLTRPLNSQMQFSLSKSFLESLQADNPEINLLEIETDGWKLEPSISDTEYLSLVKQCLEDISNGRFYQINLLRFYKVVGDASRQNTLNRLMQFAEPFSAYFDLPDLTIASFSPERFVKIEPSEQSLKISTFPIKGTIPRGLNCHEDNLNINTLQTSKKDHAELHMIVDLMRNDLSKISVSGSTKVIDSGTIKSFTKVHHLVAQIESELDENTTLGSILDSLTPAGSITGAPKIEVMKAIKSYESKARRYFMGNIFYWDHSGNFDSSILIRTLVKETAKNFDFAAGSGIVINSDPENEMQEVVAKCRVITESK